MRVLIAGAGAVGGFLAWKLAAAGWHVTALARGATADALETRGLRVRSGGAETTMPLRVMRDLGGAPADGFELVVATVKMPDLPALAAGLRDALAPNGAVIAVQNGLGAEEILAGAVGAARVVGGVAYVGVDCPEPGTVRHIAGGRLSLGPLPGGDPTRAARLSLQLTAAGIPCQLADDLRALRWSKLVWNAAFNPVTALADVTVGEVVDDPRLRGVVRTAMEEVAAVARAAGVALPADLVERHLAIHPDFRAGLTSMLQDVRAGRRTEIDAILGEVLRQAADHGLATPTLDVLYALAAPSGRPRAT